jgi:hypothetical protein
VECPKKFIPTGLNRRFFYICHVMVLPQAR